MPCPHCQSPVAMSVDQLNRSTRCPSCFRDFVVSFGIHPTPTAPAVPPQAYPPPPAPVARPPMATPVYQVVAPVARPKKARWVRVQVSARLLHWPRMCACCGGPFEVVRQASCSRLDSRNRLQTKWWEVPYCGACDRQIASGEYEDAVRYEEFHASVHTFRFWSPEYAEAFRGQNSGKVLGW